MQEGPTTVFGGTGFLGRAIVRFFRSPGADGLRQRDFVERFARLFLRAAGRPEAEQRVFDLCRRRLAI